MNYLNGFSYINIENVLQEIIDVKIMIKTNIHILVTDFNVYKKILNIIKKLVKNDNIFDSFNVFLKYNRRVIKDIPLSEMKIIYSKLGKTALEYFISNFVFVKIHFNGFKEIISNNFNMITLFQPNNKQYFEPKFYVNRQRLFFSNEYITISKTLFLNELFNLNNESIIQHITYTENVKNTIFNIDKKVNIIIKKFNKIPIKQLFINQFNTSNPLNVILLTNFLFCLSKKFLKPIFTYRQFKVLKGKLSLFIKKNSLENIGLTELVKYFNITHCKLFLRIKYTRQENMMCNAIFRNFLILLFNVFFGKIIKKYVFIEKNTGKNLKCIFYNKYQRNIIIQKECNNILKKYDIVEPQLHYNTIQLKQKQNGFRIITNCMVNNCTLRPIIPFLRNIIKKKNNSILFGFNDIQQQLLKFYSNNTWNLYLCVFDLTDCYDNIILETLIQYIDNLFGMVEMTSPISIIKYKKLVLNTITDTFFITTNYTIAPFIKNHNFLYYFCHYYNYTAHNIYLLIKNTIKMNIIKYKNQYYKAKKGIPQGLSISPYLCNLYLSNIKKIYFNFITHGMLLNYADDFLLLTNNIEEYTITCKLLYTLRSPLFQINLNKIAIPNTTKPFVIWCGFKIYKTGFAIKWNYPKDDFNYYFSIPNNSQGKKLFIKINLILNSKLNRILFNRKNTKRYENLFDLFMYIFRILKSLFLRCDFINEAYLHKIIQSIIQKVKLYCQFPDPLVNKIIKDTSFKTGIYHISNKKFH